jgi:tRNA-binding protein
MNQITFQDFEKVAMYVGTIISINEFDKAVKPAFQMQIDFGPLGIKNSSAQITKRYLKENLEGKQVLAVLNLPSKQIANFMSECLVLGIYANGAEDVVLIQPEQKVENGTRVG